MDLKELIKGYLANAKMMQLATCADNQPWVSNVWFAADDDMNIYWFSSTNHRHSEEVIKNNKVAAAIVFPQTPQDAPRGLQLEGTAELLLKEEDLFKARSVYQGKIFDADTIDNLFKNAEKPHRFYRLKPKRYVLYDVLNFPENPRRVLDL